MENVLAPPYVQDAFTSRNSSLTFIVSTPNLKAKMGCDRFVAFPYGHFYGGEVQEEHPFELMREKVSINEKTRWKNEFSNFVSDKHLLKSDETQRAIDLIIQILKSMKVQNVVFEKTPDDTVLIKAIFLGIDMFLDILFDSEETDGYDATLTAFNQKRHLVSVSGTISHVVESFLKTAADSKFQEFEMA